MNLTEQRIACPLSLWSGKVGCCQWCGNTLPSARRKTWCSDTCRRVWERNHVWRKAVVYARRRAKYRCSRPTCSAEKFDVEINHITPRVGQGYGVGCHNHQNPDAQGEGGLEALCHKHHVEVTNLQRAARKARQA